MVVGAVLLIGGAVVRFVPGAVSWFGHLPGDIRLEGENTRVFIPLTSMIVLSVILTLVINVAMTVFRNR